MEIFSQVGLLWIPEDCLLLCRDCGYRPLTQNFARHLRRKHRRSVTTERIELLKEHLEGFDLKEAREFQEIEARPAFSFLPVHDGWKCGFEGCSWCSKSRKQMRRHVATHDVGAGHRRHKVQKFPGKFQSYFLVVQDAPAGRPAVTGGWAREKMAPFLAPVRNEEVQVAQQNLFYGQMGLYAQRTYDSLWLSWTVLPMTSTDPDSELCDWVYEITCTALDVVDRLDAQLRFRILTGHAREGHLFLRLQEDKTIESYAKTMSQLAVFASRFLVANPDGTSAGVKSCLVDLRQMDDGSRVIKFLVALAQESKRGPDSPEPVLKSFIYAMTRRKANGTLPGFNFVSKICSRVSLLFFSSFINFLLADLSS